jgi:hypothetical protein
VILARPPRQFETTLPHTPRNRGGNHAKRQAPKGRAKPRFHRTILARRPVRVERRVPIDWVEGVARLNYFRPPTDVPRHRWRQFVSDYDSFLNSSENWAERAAELGWNARALFGCHCNYPLMLLGSAGLLWAINGGKLVELHRNWAVIELPVNRSQRIYYRRTLPRGKSPCHGIEHNDRSTRGDL